MINSIRSALPVLLVTFLCLPGTVQAQKNMKILDAEDSSAIAYCRIWNDSKSILYHADGEGNFTFFAPQPGQVVILESLGHEAVKINLDSITGDYRVFLEKKGISIGYGGANSG